MQFPYLSWLDFYLFCVWDHACYPWFFFISRSIKDSLVPYFYSLCFSASKFVSFQQRILAFSFFILSVMFSLMGVFIPFTFTIIMIACFSPSYFTIYYYLSPFTLSLFTFFGFWPPPLPICPLFCLPPFSYSSFPPTSI